MALQRRVRGGGGHFRGWGGALDPFALSGNLVHDFPKMGHIVRATQEETQN